MKKIIKTIVILLAILGSFNLWQHVQQTVQHFDPDFPENKSVCMEGEWNPSIGFAWERHFPDRFLDYKWECIQHEPLPEISLDVLIQEPLLDYIDFGKTSGSTVDIIWE